jgi:anthranilate synthase/aminodeoxychorismate synthase-like glutamine amidotransferase
MPLATQPGMNRVLLIDNYDSFTYNLAQAFMSLGAEVIVHRNDEITINQSRNLAPTHIVISPGPGGPQEAGISMDIIRAFAGHVPILGVCLGHQAIGAVYGGEIIRASRLMHGKPSMVMHDNIGLYAGLPNPFEAGRYHSLTIGETTLPAVLRVTSRTTEGEIMGVRHREMDIEGVQFHPESVLTPQGNTLLANFLARKPAAAATINPQVQATEATR